MARPPRCVIPHWPHHVLQRGVRKEPLFHEDRDFLVYIRVLLKATLKHQTKIIAYALMTNHVHLVVVPESEDSISSSLHDAHTDYSTYFNAKYTFVGHAWQGRPRMFPMQSRYMWNAIRYVERNPVRAGMVQRAEDYLWSSAAAHCGRREDILLNTDFLPQGVVTDWSDWLSLEQPPEELRKIRTLTSTGRLWAEPELLKQLEQLTGRKLTPGKPGRPPKVNSF